MEMLINDLRLALSKCQDHIQHQLAIIQVKDDAITALNSTLQEYHDIVTNQNTEITKLKTECDRKDDTIALLNATIETMQTIRGVL